MMRTSCYRRWFVALFPLITVALSLAVGCGATQGRIYLKGLSPLNQDEQNISRQVRIHVYELKGCEKFLSVPYDDLYTDEKAQKKLEEERLGPPKVYTIDPGREVDEPVVKDLGTLKSETTHIGVVGLFEGGAEKSFERRIVVPVGELENHIIAFKEYVVILAAKK